MDKSALFTGALDGLKPPYITSYVNVSIPDTFQNEAKLFLIQRIREINTFITRRAQDGEINHLTVPNMENIAIKAHPTRSVSAIVFHGMTEKDIRDIASYIQNERALFLADIAPIVEENDNTPTLFLQNLYLYFRPNHMRYTLHHSEIIILTCLTLLAGIAVMSTPYMNTWTLILFLFFATAMMVVYFSRETVVTPTMSPLYYARRSLHSDHLDATGLIQSCPHESNFFDSVGGVCV